MPQPITTMKVTRMLLQKQSDKVYNIYLPFDNHDTSLIFLEFQMFLPVKVHHFDLTLRWGMFPPFKVCDFNLIGDKLF